jgi:hypothetical protein
MVAPEQAGLSRPPGGLLVAAMARRKAAGRVSYRTHSTDSAFQSDAQAGSPRTGQGIAEA